MKRSLIIVTSVVLAGAGLLLVRSKRAEPTAVTPPSPTAVAPPVVGTAPPAHSARPCRFSNGQRLAFSLSATTSVALAEQFSSFAGAQSPPQSTSSALLNLEVVRVETSSAVLLARLTQLSDTVEVAGGQGVEHAWLTRINERCEVQGFARHTSTPRRAGRQQQAMLHELWFSLPPTLGPTMVSFDNATGHASAFVMPAVAGSGSVVRAIQRFESAWASTMNGVVVEKSHTQFDRGDALWFETMSGEEEVSVPGTITRARSLFSAAATPPDEAVLSGASRTETDYVWESCFSEVPDQALRPYAAPDHAQRVEAMRNFTYPQALEKMLTSFETTTNLNEQSRDMAAFLDGHPDQIPEYAGALLTEFEPEWKAAGFLVLANTRDVAAREVLLDVWRERKAPSMDRIRASLALVSRQDVGLPLAKELLVEAKRDGTPAERNVSQQALLHVAILAGLRPKEEPLLGEVRAGLVSELAARKTPIESAAVWAAIGNTGSLEYLPELEAASRNPDPEWRAIVPVGMRRMPVAGVRDFTLGWLRRETSPDVMRELFDVIHQQYQDAGKPVDDELAAEAVKYLRRQPRLLTRQSIVLMLRHHVSVNDDVRAAFREQLKIEYESNTGMFSYLASCLPEEDVQAVLATIPSLADQHRAMTLPSSNPPPAPAERAPPPDMLPKLDVGEVGR